MQKKTIRKLWAGSLLTIGIASILMFGTNLIGIRLPDMIIRILGVCDLVALPILVATTVILFIKKE